jgi:hypothetical protein
MLTQNELHKALDYDPATGHFTWRYRPEMNSSWTTRYTGQRAGCIKEGYCCIRINGKEYWAHRLVWLYVYGVLPWKGLEIDHINGHKGDNRLKNLRAVTRADNLANAKISARNKSGVKGVGWSKSQEKWQAHICRHRKFTHLGFFKKFDDAVRARRLAEKKLHGEFARSA